MKPPRRKGHPLCGLGAALLVSVTAAAKLYAAKPGQTQSGQPQAAPASAAPAKEPTANKRQKVQIAVVPAALRFATTRFDVRVGSPLQITLKNTCVMPHNLVIGMPGKADAIVAGAMALGQEGFAKNFVPAGADVLAYVPVVSAGTSSSVGFNAPSEPGEYPFLCTFPGHGTVMRGIMRVRAESEELEAAITEKLSDTKQVDALALSQATSKPIGTSQKPLVLRSFVPNPGLDSAVFPNHSVGKAARKYNPASGKDEAKGVINPVSGIPGGIAVSFGPEFAYVWDSTECRLLYAWTGGFLDMTPFWGAGTGGERAGMQYTPKLEGTLVFKTAGPLPLQPAKAETAGTSSGNPATPSAKPKFKGYRIQEGVPEFLYEIGGMKVSEKILPGSGNFTVHCRIENPPEPVRLIFDASVRDQIQCDQGSWKDNVLVIPADHGDYFILTVAYKKGATFHPESAPASNQPLSEEP